MHSRTTCVSPAPVAKPTARGPLQRLVALARLVWRVSYERRLLGQMDERALKDLGISRNDAVREAARSWWDLPDSRTDIL